MSKGPTGDTTLVGVWLSHHNLDACKDLFFQNKIYSLKDVPTTNERLASLCPNDSGLPLLVAKARELAGPEQQALRDASTIDEVIFALQSLQPALDAAKGTEQDTTGLDASPSELLTATTTTTTTTTTSTIPASAMATLPSSATATTSPGYVKPQFVRKKWSALESAALPKEKMRSFEKGKRTDVGKVLQECLEYNEEIGKLLDQCTPGQEFQHIHKQMNATLFHYIALQNDLAMRAQAYRESLKTLCDVVSGICAKPSTATLVPSSNNSNTNNSSVSKKTSMGKRALAAERIKTKSPRNRHTDLSLSPPITVYHHHLSTTNATTSTHQGDSNGGGDMINVNLLDDADASPDGTPQGDIPVGDVPVDSADVGGAGGDAALDAASGNPLDKSMPTVGVLDLGSVKVSHGEALPDGKRGRKKRVRDTLDSSDGEMGRSMMAGLVQFPNTYGDGDRNPLFTDVSNSSSASPAQGKRTFLAASTGSLAPEPEEEKVTSISSGWGGGVRLRKRGGSVGKGGNAGASGATSTGGGGAPAGATDRERVHSPPVSKPAGLLPTFPQSQVRRDYEWDEDDDISE